MGQAAGRRPIGRILRDGGFLSDGQLEKALAEQQRTNELLGQVLVRTGVLEAGELKAALAVQEHLGDLEQAVRLGAGVRQMLGSLLVEAGKLTAGELEQVLAEQQEAGGKLGEICLRLGIVSEPELSGVLAFQRHQCPDRRHATPLRLGELLVCAGHISRDQLVDALRKQAVSRKKLGEVLVEEGYAQPAQISHGVRLQQLLMRSVLAAILSLSAMTMAGCGSSGQPTAAAPAVSASAGLDSQPSGGLVKNAADYFVMTSEDYGLLKPSLYYSTDNSAFWSIQADLAKIVTDIDGVSIYRMEIPKQGGALPALNKTFSIEDGTGLEKFPGDFLVFNGQKSVRKKVERGTISFSPDSTASGLVSGSFDVTLTDYDSATVPAPQYRLKGSFNFVMGTYNAANTGA